MPRAELPAGTVTFLFTDVEGSTRLLHEHGERYAELLSEHRRLLREAFRRHGGVEVDTQGDAFFYAFARASDALAAAEEGRRALEPTPIRVRIGIHTGEPTLSEEGYVGLDVHKAARIAAAGHGGQVLVSEQTARLAGSDGLLDLGLHRLKDLGEPVKLFQLGEGEHPPPRTLNATNLPAQPSPLVGRERELDELLDLVRSGARLLVLTGAGGSGKTRLALQLAAELVGEFVDGVFWVPLQAVDDPTLVLPTVASTLGAKGELAEHLDEKRMLLLLDNLEQLLPDAAGSLAELLSGCPNLVLLVTSRALLRVAAEREYPVDPLPVADAVALFRERAANAEPEEAAVEICRRLDGLPLAVELAAARTRALPPQTLLARLEHALPLLTGGARDAPARQRTLEATIAWSHDLLSTEEQRLFRRLATFAGGFELEAAEEVCDADLDTLASLVEKSLLRRWSSGRLGMLETIREFALAQLEAAGEVEEVRERHCRFFVLWVSSLPGADGGYRGPASAVEPHHANLRAAVEHALAHRDGERVATVLQATWPYLLAAGHVVEGIDWGERVLDGALPADARAQVELALSELTRAAGDFERSAELKRRLLERAAAGNPAAEGWRRAILADLCDIAVARGDLATARRYGEEAVAAGGGPRALASIGDVELLDGNLAEAERMHREVERAWRDSPYADMLAWALWSLGHIAYRKGAHGQAAERWLEGADLFRQLGDAASAGDCLDGVALLAADAGDRWNAGMLLGAAAAFRSAHGRERNSLPDVVEPDVSDDARRAGASLTLDEALELARASVD